MIASGSAPPPAAHFSNLSSSSANAPPEAARSRLLDRCKLIRRSETRHTLRLPHTGDFEDVRNFGMCGNGWCGE
jgi:hypothetical protein